jgi:2-dehydropantoate 2-reductase
MTGPRIAIVGAGAIGGTLAAALSASGHRPELVARGARAAALRADGLRYADAGGAETVHRLPVGTASEFGAQDIVFLAVKADALPVALPEAAPLIGPETLVVPLVNGIPWWYFLDQPEPRPVHAVDPAGVLLRLIPARQIVGCVLLMTAEMDDAGVVRGKALRRLTLGMIDGRDDPRLAALAMLLAEAGISADLSAAIRRPMWAKVALNLATNPLSVVTLSTLADQFNGPDLIGPVTAVLEEVRALAAALGITLPISLDEMIAIGRGAGAFETSMLQDHRRGRPLELAAIADAVFELADHAAVPMPAARTVCALARYAAGVRSR